MYRSIQRAEIDPNTVPDDGYDRCESCGRQLVEGEVQFCEECEDEQADEDEL